MKRRIFSVFALLTALVTIATTLSVCVLYYGFYRETVKSGLQDECYALARSVEESQDVPELLRQVGYALGRNTRMTLVGTDGAVLFDSGLAASTLPNHGDREEFMQAREQGFGEATRHSDTLNADTYYYAVALENGNLLRLSRTMNSILDVFRHRSADPAGAGALPGALAAAGFPAHQDDPASRQRGRAAGRGDADPR